VNGYHNVINESNKIIGFLNPDYASYD
jgi:hypothetical protein